MLDTVSEFSAPAPRLRPLLPRGKLMAVGRLIETRFNERLTLDQMARVAGLSVFRFVTVFGRQFGFSPHRYLCMVRVRAAQELLRNGVPTAIVAIEVGFCDQSHLCRHFRAVCGMTPGQFILLASLSPNPRAGSL